MQFDFSKLLGRIKEYGYTQERLAEEISMAKTTLNLKLNNKNKNAYFTAPEIEKIRSILHIDSEEIGVYFFTLRVQEN